MGQKTSNTVLSSSKNEQEIIDDKISKQLHEEKEKEEKEIKILFFGLPSSGGTIIIHKIKEYMEERKQKQNGTNGTTENASFKEIIQFHSLRGVQQIIHASNILDIPLFGQRDKNKEKLQLKVEELSSLHFTFHQTTLTPEMGQTIKMIWQLKGAKQIFEKQNDEKISHFTDIKHAKYFLDNIERISAPTYVPSDEDVKYYHEQFNQDCRGVEEIAFEFSDQRYRIFNIEGQVGEKRKWLSHFDSVKIVCFLVPIGDYDEPPIAVGRKNIVQESYQLFKSIVNTHTFKNTPVIVLFTKHDVFLEKIDEVDMICCFEDYMGGCVEKEALKYINEKFTNMRATQDKVKAKPLISSESIYDDDCLGPNVKKNNTPSKVTETVNTQDNPEIYINFVSKKFTLQEIVNNLGGTMKNIQYMKQFEEIQKKKQEQQQKLQEKLTKDFAPLSADTANFFSALTKRMSFKQTKKGSVIGNASPRPKPQE